MRGLLRSRMLCMHGDLLVSHRCSPHRMGDHSCSESYAHCCACRSLQDRAGSEIDCPSTGLAAHCSTHHHPGGTSPFLVGVGRQRFPEQVDQRGVVYSSASQQGLRPTTWMGRCCARVEVPCRATTLARRRMPQRGLSFAQRRDQRSGFCQGSTLRSRGGSGSVAILPSSETTPSAVRNAPHEFPCAISSNLSTATRHRMTSNTIYGGSR